MDGEQIVNKQTNTVLIPGVQTDPAGLRSIINAAESSITGYGQKLILEKSCEQSVKGTLQKAQLSNGPKNISNSVGLVKDSLESLNNLETKVLKMQAKLDALSQFKNRNNSKDIQVDVSDFNKDTKLPSLNQNEYPVKTSDFAPMDNAEFLKCQEPSNNLCQGPCDTSPKVWCIKPESQTDSQIDKQFTRHDCIMQPVQGKSNSNSGMSHEKGKGADSASPCAMSIRHADSLDSINSYNHRILSDPQPPGGETTITMTPPAYRSTNIRLPASLERHSKNLELPGACRKIDVARGNKCTGCKMKHLGRKFPAELDPVHEDRNSYEKHFECTYKTAHASHTDEKGRFLCPVCDNISADGWISKDHTQQYAAPEDPKPFLIGRMFCPPLLRSV